MISIVLTIHNKERSIRDLLDLLNKNTSALCDEIIIIFDGCTDNSYNSFKSIEDQLSKKFSIRVLSTPDIWEVKANNIGLKQAKNKLAIIIQDDMHIMQKNWDRILYKALNKTGVFSVSGRDVHSFVFKSALLSSTSVKGRDFPLGPSGTFFGDLVALWFRRLKLYWIFKYWSPTYLGLCANRGPWLLRLDLIKKLGYLDEEFAPFELDDIDICCRAYKHFGLMNAAKPIHYKEINGSKAGGGVSQEMSIKCHKKNSYIIYSRHKDLSQS